MRALRTTTTTRHQPGREARQPAWPRNDHGAAMSAGVRSSVRHGRIGPAQDGPGAARPGQGGEPGPCPSTSRAVPAGGTGRSAMRPGTTIRPCHDPGVGPGQEQQICNEGAARRCSFVAAASPGGRAAIEVALGRHQRVTILRRAAHRPHQARARHKELPRPARALVAPHGRESGAPQGTPDAGGALPGIVTCPAWGGTRPRGYSGGGSALLARVDQPRGDRCSTTTSLVGVAG